MRQTRQDSKPAQQQEQRRTCTGVKASVLLRPFLEKN
jgi:hypothetical protein